MLRSCYLQSSLSQERQSRISVEARLREATAKTAALEKEMQNSRAVSDEKSQHYTSLQQSVCLIFPGFV